MFNGTDNEWAAILVEIYDALENEYDPFYLRTSLADLFDEDAKGDQNTEAADRSSGDLEGALSMASEDTGIDDKPFLTLWQLIGWLLLIRPLLLLGRVAGKKLTRSWTALAALLCISAAVVITGVVFLVYYWEEASYYAAAAVPGIGLAVGVVTAVIKRWQQYKEFAPSVKFGRGTGADTAMNMQGQIGFLGEVRKTVRLLMQFVNENPLERGGRLYHVKIILTIDDLDRCQPSTIAEVMRCIQMFLVDPAPNKGADVEWVWPLICVLFIDPAVVEPAIEASLPDNTVATGRDYLEKIVQLLIVLPDDPNIRREITKATIKDLQDWTPSSLDMNDNGDLDRRYRGLMSAEIPTTIPATDPRRRAAANLELYHWITDAWTQLVSSAPTEANALAITGSSGSTSEVGSAVKRRDAPKFDTTESQLVAELHGAQLNARRMKRVLNSWLMAVHMVARIDLAPKTMPEKPDPLPPLDRLRRAAYEHAAQNLEPVRLSDLLTDILRWAMIAERWPLRAASVTLAAETICGFSKDQRKELKLWMEKEAIRLGKWAVGKVDDSGQVAKAETGKYDVSGTAGTGRKFAAKPEVIKRNDLIRLVATGAVAFAERSLKDGSLSERGSYRHSFNTFFRDVANSTAKWFGDRSEETRYRKLYEIDGSQLEFDNAMGKMSESWFPKALLESGLLDQPDLYTQEEIQASLVENGLPGTFDPGPVPHLAEQQSSYSASATFKCFVSPAVMNSVRKARALDEDVVPVDEFTLPRYLTTGVIARRTMNVPPGDAEFLELIKKGEVMDSMRLLGRTTAISAIDSQGNSVWHHAAGMYEPAAFAAFKDVVIPAVRQPADGFPGAQESGSVADHWSKALAAVRRRNIRGQLPIHLAIKNYQKERNAANSEEVNPPDGMRTNFGRNVAADIIALILDLEGELVNGELQAFLDHNSWATSKLNPWGVGARASSAEQQLQLLHTSQRGPVLPFAAGLFDALEQANGADGSWAITPAEALLDLPENRDSTRLNLDPHGTYTFNGAKEDSGEFKEAVRDEAYAMLLAAAGRHHAALGAIGASGVFDGHHCELLFGSTQLVLEVELPKLLLSDCLMHSKKLRRLVIAPSVNTAGNPPKDRGAGLFASFTDAIARASAGGRINLESLELRGSWLSGTLPKALWKLTQLKELVVNDTMLNTLYDNDHYIHQFMCVAPSGKSLVPGYRYSQTAIANSLESYNAEVLRHAVVAGSIITVIERPHALNVAADWLVVSLPQLDVAVGKTRIVELGALDHCYFEEFARTEDGKPDKTRPLFVKVDKVEVWRCERPRLARRFATLVPEELDGPTEGEPANLRSGAIVRGSVFQVNGTEVIRADDGSCYPNDEKFDDDAFGESPFVVQGSRRAPVAVERWRCKAEAGVWVQPNAGAISETVPRDGLGRSVSFGETVSGAVEIATDGTRCLHLIDVAVIANKGVAASTLKFKVPPQVLDGTSQTGYVPHTNGLTELFERVGAVDQDRGFELLMDSVSRMTKLDLKKNKFLSIPEALAAALSSIEQIDISVNSIEALPMTLLDCARIKKLNMSQNLVSCIPEAFGEKLINLEALDCSSNKAMGSGGRTGNLLALIPVTCTKCGLGGSSKGPNRCACNEFLGDPPPRAVSAASPLLRVGDRVTGVVWQEWLQLIHHPHTDRCNPMGLRYTRGVFGNTDGGCTCGVPAVGECVAVDIPSSKVRVKIMAMSATAGTPHTEVDILPEKLRLVNTTIRGLGSRVIESAQSSSVVGRFESISGLEKLNTISLDHCMLTGLDLMEMGTMSKLTQLHIDGNPLQVIPDCIWKSTCLQDLSLRNCRLSVLPDDVSALKDLVIINLADNQLEWLPAELGKCKKLEQLMVQANRLVHEKSFPQELGTLDALLTINIGGNNLHENWNSGCFSEMKELRSWYLEGTGMTEWPKGFCNLQKLVPWCVSDFGPNYPLPHAS